MIVNKKLERNAFEAIRQEVLKQWPTGKDVQLEEAIAYQENIPSHKRFGNRLNHINNSLKNVLLPSVDKHYKRAVELLELLKKEYKIDENTDVNVAIF
jgi:methylaspartate mutase epsilon subunit